MSARRWFTVENTHGLTKADVAVLNRAARHAEDKYGKLQRVHLTVLRTAYVRGMTADQLLRASEGEREFPQ